MLIFAHRGASATEPENTLRSFKKAEEVGVDGIELDVRQSKDGQIVVFHDRTLHRLFGIDKEVSDLTVAELKEISKTREIPTLEEVLNNIHSDLNIEIKVRGIEDKVLSIIKNFPHKVLISSFYPGVLKKIRALDGNIHLGLNFLKEELTIESVISFLVRKVKLHSIHVEDKYISSATVILLRLLAKDVYVWTVNSREEYGRMKKLGVDGIFTDYPELIKSFENNESSSI